MDGKAEAAAHVDLVSLDEEGPADFLQHLAGDTLGGRLRRANPRAPRRTRRRRCAPGHPIGEAPRESGSRAPSRARRPRDGRACRSRP
jgi:hypothetical protein